jgi:hypothetical protein
MNYEALQEAEAAEALAARRLLSPKGVRVDAALQTDLEDYTRCRARSEELRRVMTDKMHLAGEREWGDRDHKSRGGHRGPTTREVMAEIVERNLRDTK